ncbi:MAG: hypothetical protein AAFR67_11820 [Chloroflexota bacterium]
MNFNLGTGSNRLYNILTIVFLVGAIIACGVTALLFLLTDSNTDDLFDAAAALPTEFATGTPTITLTPSTSPTTLPASFTPTFTPTLTPTLTLTPIPSATTTPSLEPSPTITTTDLPTSSPSPTLSPEPTTPVAGTLPPSPSPFLFALQSEPQYTSNINASGCTWQGIGGQILDLNGNAYSNPLTIRVVGGGLPAAREATSGSNTLYGNGGYEVQLANGINTQTYFVQVFTSLGTPVTEQVQVTFSGTCEGNLALLTFQQTRSN